jgi:hypothetical protein
VFEPLSWWGVLDTTLCDKVCQWVKLTAMIYLQYCWYWH